MMAVHTEPKLGWTRFAGFLALFHAFIYTIIAAKSNSEISTAVLWFDAFVFGCWALGGNGRAALVDAIRNWKGNTNA